LSRQRENEPHLLLLCRLWDDVTYKTHMTRVFSERENFEIHGVLTKATRIFTVPLLNALPASFIQRVMRASSHDAATVVAKGGSTHALEAMYTRYHRGIFSRGFLQGLADMFWHHFVSQPKALRNRLRIVQQLLEKEIRSRNTPVFVLSIAGGSARSLIQTSAKLQHEHFPQQVRVTVIDKDASALDVGKRVAASAGVSGLFQWIQGDAGKIGVLFPDIQFDIVEIVGLLDYFDDERVLHLLCNVRVKLSENSALIVANVMPNREMLFVQKTGWPPMFYRTPDDFARLVEKASFNVRATIQEPLRVHTVIRASVT